MRSKVYLPVFLASVLMVVLQERIHWYHPLLPGLMYFFGRSRLRHVQDGMLIATIHGYAKGIAEISNDPEKFLASIEEMRYDVEGKVGLRFIEQYQRPASASLWIVFTSSRILILVQILAVIGCSVLGNVSLLRGAGVLLVSLFIGYVLEDVSDRLLFSRALGRWTANHLADLNSKPSVKAQLLATSNVTEEELPAWLRLEIERMYFAGVHPDNFHFGGRSEPRPSNAE